MLLASIISVLISFAAFSLVVIPLQHWGLMAYSISIGGLISFIGIFFFNYVFWNWFALEILSLKSCTRELVNFKHIRIYQQISF
jgi:hypothetical protein